MTNLTAAFRVRVAEKFAASVNLANTSYYVFAARSRPWDDDNNPPAVESSLKVEQFDPYDTLIFGKRVLEDDVNLLTQRHNWTANTVYSIYDNEDADLANSAFFVTIDANTAYHVFKCLNNAAGEPSTVAPAFEETAADDEFYFTSDGYQWKYLYTIDTTTFGNFATANVIPIIENSNVTSNAISGAIDVILVESAGIGYNSYANGFFQEIAVSGDALIHSIESNSSANSNFYNGCAIKIVAGTGSGQQRTISDYIVSGGQKRIITAEVFNPLPDLTSEYEITPNVVIEGDGSSAIARAIVNATSNTISHVEITARGTDYKFATATVVGNTGFANVSSNSYVTNNAILRVIIGPEGGHGADLAAELFATSVGFAVSFSNNESNTVPDTGHFRQIGLLQNALFANVQFEVANTAGTFSDDETIVLEGTADAVGRVTLYNSGAGTLRVTDCIGNVTQDTEIRGLTSNAYAKIATVQVQGISKEFETFDQRYRFGATFDTVFAENEFVTQDFSEATGYVQQANSTFFAATQVRGTFATSLDVTTDNGKIGTVSSIREPDLIKMSGQVIYIDNIQPVSRSANTAEAVKLIIQF